MSTRRSRKAPSAAAAADSPELPQECLHAIFERLPPNCIPLAIRQLSKEWSQRYQQRTTVQAAGDGFLPAWGVLAALPEMHEHQKPKLLPALARRGDLEGMQQLVLIPAQPWRCAGALYAAAAIGRLDIVHWLVEEQGCSDLANSSAATTSAASGGHQHVLAYLRAHEPPFLWDWQTLAAAAQGGHVETMQWLLSSGCGRLGLHVTSAAAGGGQLEALQWLRTKGCPWNEQTCAVAAGAGALEVLQYLRANGCPWDELAVMHTAAWNGHLCVVRWCHENGCAWRASFCTAAAERGHLDVLQYLVQEGCPTVAYLCDRAAIYGRKHVLLWLRGNGHPWTESVCITAAQRGDLQLLQWLRQQVPPCPWNSSVVRWLALYGRKHAAQCLEYVLSNGCPWDMEVYRLVQRDPALRHVQFPGVRRSKRLQKG